MAIHGLTTDLRREYQAWVTSVLDTRDAVQCAYSGGTHSHRLLDCVSGRLLLDMLQQPNTFRVDGRSYSERMVAAAGLLLSEETPQLSAGPASIWNIIERWLRDCPDRLQPAVLSAFVYGETVPRTAERMGCSLAQTRQLRVAAAQYLQKIVDDVWTVSAAPGNAGQDLRELAAENRLEFWAEQARELLWDNDFTKVIDWTSPPFARWFVGGRINVAINCVDRHVDAGHGERIAFHCVGEYGHRRDITYRQLQREVAKAANCFTDSGLRPGDRVAICMPAIPQAIVAMLACARIGAVHVVLRADSAADALGAQISDCQPKAVITSDGRYHRETVAAVKPVVDAALAAAGSGVQTVFVVRHTQSAADVPWVDGRDVWWHDTVERAGEHHEAPSYDAEHPLFLLYDADEHAQARGIVHSSGGYLTHARFSFHHVFDHGQDRDVFWADAPIESGVGHHLIYGALADGATSVIYEGSAATSHPRRALDIIERYRVTIYCAAPQVITASRKWEPAMPGGPDLSSLRLLVVMSDSSDPQSWQWYRDMVGGPRCPVVDVWWQRETGAVMIAPVPGLTAAIPGSPVAPLPGISAHIVDRHGDLVSTGERGQLVIDRPWPSMPRGIWGNDSLFREAYWSHFPHRTWFATGVEAYYDDADTIWILSEDTASIGVVACHRRSDDVHAALAG
ncbi:AMP-binding protein [Mycobacterium sp. 3519A]|uniref:AMP-binding protein n=1 Tax=Mycobacterium sp. 3519A TaxID=2057184 RepID=UPI00135781A6|nr:AMP-binding protein [Mycobacterium sp. 3519A]